MPASDCSKSAVKSRQQSALELIGTVLTSVRLCPKTVGIVCPLYRVNMVPCNSGILLRKICNLPVLNALTWLRAVSSWACWTSSCDQYLSLKWQLPDSGTESPVLGKMVAHHAFVIDFRKSTWYPLLGEFRIQVAQTSVLNAFPDTAMF